MKNFVDLVQSRTLIKGVDDFSKPGQTQRNAARSFEEAVRRSGLFLWNEGRKPRFSENRMVIGVNTASLYDMALLDAVKSFAVPLKQNGVRVEVFNVYHFQTLQEFEARIPGLDMVFRTPVVGIWENGRWEEQGSGVGARELIHRYVEKVMQSALQKLITNETRKTGDASAEVAYI